MDAILQSGEFPPAMKFAADRITGNRAYLPTMMNSIGQEVDRLVKRKDYKKALDLLDASTAANFPVEYVKQFESLKDRVRRSQQNGGLFWWPGVESELASAGWFHESL